MPDYATKYAQCQRCTGLAFLWPVECTDGKTLDLCYRCRRDEEDRILRLHYNARHRMLLSIARAALATERSSHSSKKSSPKT